MFFFEYRLFLLHCNFRRGGGGEGNFFLFLANMARNYYLHPLSYSLITLKRIQTLVQSAGHAEPHRSQNVEDGMSSSLFCRVRKKY
jgi:hypothetical protein